MNGGDDLSEEDTEDEEGDVRERVEDEDGDEDLCEKRVVSLLALPNANVTTYTQENAHYFATRKYVSQRQVHCVINDLQGPCRSIHGFCL